MSKAFLYQNAKDELGARCGGRLLRPGRGSGEGEGPQGAGALEEQRGVFCVVELGPWGGVGKGKARSGPAPLFDCNCLSLYGGGSLKTIAECLLAPGLLPGRAGV